MLSTGRQQSSGLYDEKEALRLRDMIKTEHVRLLGILNSKQIEGYITQVAMLATDIKFASDPKRGS